MILSECNLETIFQLAGFLTHDGVYCMNEHITNFARGCKTRCNIPSFKKQCRAEGEGNFVPATCR